MAQAAKKKRRTTGRRGVKGQRRAFRPVRWLLRWLLRGLLAGVVLILVLVGLFAVVDPPVTHTIWSEQRRLGEVDREWVPLEDIAPVLARSVVAAEDARFCQHWGFDVQAIRAAIEGGATRGASSLTQQVVKNVFLWQGRSWTRKALETLITPVVEAIWTKRRILEVYLNVAEMDEGVFGAEAAARKYFGVGPEALSPGQAALIAAVLPAPRVRSAKRPTTALRRRADQILDGAATIAKDGRAACFERAGD